MAFKKAGLTVSAQAVAATAATIRRSARNLPQLPPGARKSDPQADRLYYLSHLDYIAEAKSDPERAYLLYREWRAILAKIRAQGAEKRRVTLARGAKNTSQNRQKSLNKSI